VFAGGSAASAGAAAVLVTPSEHSGPARRLALLGSLVELGAEQTMQSRLGELAEPYRSGRARVPAKAAKALLAGGAALLASGRGRPRRARLGAAMTLAGVALTRWAVFQAGFDSAEDPRFTVKPQRERLMGG
jgi:hypothetical protein